MRLLPRFQTMQQGPTDPQSRYLVRLVNHLIRELDRHEVVLTADLPTAEASQDGKVLIEEAGAGVFNIIVYAGGNRFRWTGGVAF